jgi:hypothetical protein
MCLRGWSCLSAVDGMGVILGMGKVRVQVISGVKVPLADCGRFGSSAWMGRELRCNGLAVPVRRGSGHSMVWPGRDDQVP